MIVFIDFVLSELGIFITNQPNGRRLLDLFYASQDTNE
jgi:hypothetical protein